MKRKKKSEKNSGLQRKSVPKRKDVFCGICQNFWGPATIGKDGEKERVCQKTDKRVRERTFGCKYYELSSTIWCRRSDCWIHSLACTKRLTSKECSGCLFGRRILKERNKND